MTDKNDERGYYAHLVGIMLTTRGVRFSVAESEQRKEKFSIATIALLSVYLAGWSLAGSLFPEMFSSLQARALNLISVVASVSLLVISLFDFAAGRSVYAEKMLQNAFTITGILRETERELAKEDPDYSIISKLAARYEEVVHGVGVNHTSQDFKLWKLQKENALSRFQAVRIWIHSKILQVFSFTSAMIFQIAILFLIFASTIGVVLFL
ncbi:SLATT domain-containing protein [Phaeobacter inhibens]|uniref:SLATT domain-containing protein n=1 Tax=Phaeobacter inhibens TaxID=221822 RepID=UPI0021A77AB3|nr:SLATT domain-containing protein [Phaeobacter inhibens]UWR80526.1 SLATT domain-containing protein [Phaeobacter inhibens]